jgi:hypothetical protein
MDGGNCFVQVIEKHTRAGSVSVSSSGSIATVVLTFTEVANCKK